MKKYLVYESGEETWLKVSLSEIEALGIIEKISNKSFVCQTNTNVYLEDEQDQIAFITSKLLLPENPVVWTDYHIILIDQWYKANTDTIQVNPFDYSGLNVFTPELLKSPTLKN